VVPRDSGLVAAETDYPTPFASAVWHENVFATQFHPEKSQRVGLEMLRRFAEWR
jgi:glutamine amidotransferase